MLSTLAAPATVRERRSVEELAGEQRLVEINDMTALPARSGRPFVTGPFLNVYNEATAAAHGCGSGGRAHRIGGMPNEASATLRSRRAVS